MNDPAFICSALVNAVSGVAAILAVAAHVRHSPVHIVMRYFTTLSNLFCAAACLCVAAFRLTGAVPRWVLILKYAGTVEVMVTFLTVMLFLGPSFGYKNLLTGPDLWLHAVCPLLALVSYLAWDRTEGPLPLALLGALPVLLYGLMYLKKAVLEKTPEKRWDDFYGFNRGSRWPLSFAVMLTAGVLLSLALWAV